MCVCGGAQFVHGRSRMTIDPRIPIMPGRRTSGFYQSRKHGCLTIFTLRDAVIPLVRS